MPVEIIAEVDRKIDDGNGLRGGFRYSVYQGNAPSRPACSERYAELDHLPRRNRSASWNLAHSARNAPTAAARACSSAVVSASQKSPLQIAGFFCCRDQAATASPAATGSRPHRSCRQVRTTRPRRLVRRTYPAAGASDLTPRRRIAVTSTPIAEIPRSPSVRPTLACALHDQHRVQPRMRSVGEVALVERLAAEYAAQNVIAALPCGLHPPQAPASPERPAASARARQA